MKTLRTYRFELYLATLCLLLFGSLFVPIDIFLTYIDPVLILFNIAAGFVLISMRRRTRHIYAVLSVFLLIFDLIRVSQAVSENINYQIVRLGLLSVFYTIVTVEIILQVWQVKEVTRNVIFGVMGGYVSLGLVGFFLLFGIFVAEPDSFRGLGDFGQDSVWENLLYYAYITMMTIGYGDIVPVKSLAQKAAILIGLLGQFYLVIITATVVGKYIGGQQKNH